MLIFDSKFKFEFKYFHSYELSFISINTIFFSSPFLNTTKNSIKFEHATGKQGILTIN